MLDNKMKITSLNVDNMKKNKNKSLKKENKKGFIKYFCIKNIVVAVAAFLSSNPFTEYFTLRLQDVLGIEIYEMLGRNAFDVYSRLSNAIIAEPTLLALGICGVSVVGDLLVFTVNKIAKHKKTSK